MIRAKRPEEALDLQDQLFRSAAERHAVDQHIGPDMLTMEPAHAARSIGFARLHRDHAIRRNLNSVPSRRYRPHTEFGRLHLIRMSGGGGRLAVIEKQGYNRICHAQPARIYPHRRGFRRHSGLLLHSGQTALLQIGKGARTISDTSWINQQIKRRCRGRV
jgi:hypothetical protein